MKNKLNWLEGALVLAPLLVLLALHDRLPARVPIHWNLDGQVDRWASGLPALLLGPLLSLGLVALLRVLPSFDPKLRTLTETGRMPMALQATRLGLVVLFDVIFALQLSTAYGYHLSAALILDSALLILFALLGNFLGNLKPNYFFGIRTPWTLESAETWRATHRLGGRLMFFGALLLLLLQFVLPERFFIVLMLSSIGALAGWSVFYSWHHFRKHAALRD